jgi:hypothetical protein
MPLLFTLLYLFASNIYASSYININGKTYQSSNNGSVSVVNGVVIDGKVVSGGGIEGNKKIENQTRNLPGFEQLQVKLSADIEVILSNTPKIVITAEENILPIIQSVVENNRLVIKTKGNYWTTKGIKITIYTNQLNRIVINGSANVKMGQINQQKLDLLITGSGDIFVAGKVGALSAIIDGSGDMHLANLKSHSATAKISGSGDIRVYATDNLIAEITGSGDINYRGNPQSLRKSIRGSGDIDQL